MKQACPPCQIRLRVEGSRMRALRPAPADRRARAMAGGPSRDLHAPGGLESGPRDRSQGSQAGLALFRLPASSQGPAWPECSLVQAGIRLPDRASGTPDVAPPSCLPTHAAIFFQARLGNVFMISCYPPPARLTASPGGWRAAGPRRPKWSRASRKTGRAGPGWASCSTHATGRGRAAVRLVGSVPGHGPSH